MTDASRPHASLITHVSSLRLDNGARGILVARPSSPTFALQLFVRAGSRHDGGRPGLAHLVEHLVFRAPRDGQPDLFAAVEGLGGEVTATTGRDYTAFSLVVAAPDAARALALLPALVRPPAAERASVRGERQVIAHELRERTRPADALWDLLLAALWGDDPLARPPAGTLAGLPALTARAAAAFHDRHYVAPHLLVIGVGACAPEAFADAVRAGLSARPGGGSPTLPAAPASHLAALDLPLGSRGSYVAVGVAVPGVEHADSTALRTLEAALGQGPDSRLGRALAAHGLTAAVQARYAAYAGAGVFAALAAGPLTDAAVVAEALAAEVRRLATQPPTPAALRAAHRRQVGALYRRCESNAGLASALGAAALFADPDHPLDTALGADWPESVAPARRVASAYLAEPALARATLRAGG
jgi:predicted Zn-dependent peptidase